MTRSARSARLSSAVSSSSARSDLDRVTSLERSDVTAAVAAASGRRRSWPTAASSALRSRSAARRPHALGLRREVPPVERRLELGDECAENLAVGCRERLALQDQLCRRAEGNPSLLVGGGRRGVVGGHVGDHVVLQERDARHAERLAEPAHERLDGIRAADHAARDRDEHLRLGRRPVCGARSPCRLVDDEAHQRGDDEKDDERDEVGRFRDADDVERRDEEEIEEEPRADGREQGGPDAADQGDDHDEELVGEHLAREGVRAADEGQRPGHEWKPDDGERDPDDPPPQGQGTADGGESPLARLRVRDDVDVDVAGEADDAGADAGPAEDGLEPASARDADHELGCIHAARELDERDRNLIGDDVVIASAECLDEGALGVEGRGVSLG